ncbi:MAG: hypothetical protein P8H96_08170 [Akkermansiaceae bacterium]|nr:hypothetical protein [Akkermansiaceae bacterium]
MTRAFPTSAALAEKSPNPLNGKIIKHRIITDTPSGNAAEDFP